MADAPIQTLEVLQAGPETTPGTLVAATRRVITVPGQVRSGPDIPKIHRQYAGSLATSHSTSPGLQRPWVQWREPVSYDDVTRLFAMFLKGLASAGGSDLAPTGGGSDKTWTFLPGDAADLLKRYSFERGGKDTWPTELRFAGCVGDELTLTWNKTTDVTADVRLLSTQSTEGAKAAGLALPSAVVFVQGKTARVYADPTTFGSSSIGRAVSGTVRIKTGAAQRYGSDGNDYPNRVALVNRREVTFALRVEWDSSTLRDAWKNGTHEKLRLEFPGPVLGGSNYNLRIDFGGTFDDAPLDQDGGVTVLAIAGQGEYDAGLGSDVQVTLVNSLTALP